MAGGWIDKVNHSNKIIYFVHIIHPILFSIYKALLDVCLHNGAAQKGGDTYTYLE